MSEAQKRQLKIKTSTVKRLRKELELYQNDYEAQREKFNKFKESSDACPHDVKYEEKLLLEASMMIPDTRQRLQAAYQDLTNYLAEVADALAEAEEVSCAKDVLAESSSMLQGTAIAV